MIETEFRQLEKTTNESQQEKPSSAEDTTHAGYLANYSRYLSKQFGTEVRLEGIDQGKGGWLKIRYYDKNTLEGLLQRMGIRYEENLIKCYIPPYSLNLNRVERVLRLLYKNVSYNTYYGKFSEYTGSTLGFFKSVGRKKTILQERITANFQI